VWPHILAWIKRRWVLAKINRRIAMAQSTMARKRTANTEQTRNAAGWLGLAATPTFALMAWISGTDVGAAMGSSAHGALPLGGMAWMYLLMSLFYLPPWLKLASDLTQSRIQPAPQNRGD
jgi:hypothetical protein